jgi:DNA-binding transcriptional MocR family regulator
MTRVIEKTFPESTKVTRPAGGFVLWLELPRSRKSRDLFQQALEKGICFAPGEVFSASGRYHNCLRLSCGHPWHARIEKGVTTLGALASSEPLRR